MTMKIFLVRQADTPNSLQISQFLKEYYEEHFIDCSNITLLHAGTKDAEESASVIRRELGIPGMQEREYWLDQDFRNPRPSVGMNRYYMRYWDKRNAVICIAHILQIEDIVNFFTWEFNGWMSKFGHPSKTGIIFLIDVHEREVKELFP